MEQEMRCMSLGLVEDESINCDNRKKLAGQFVQNLTMHLLQNAPSKNQIELSLLGSCKTL